MINWMYVMQIEYMEELIEIMWKSFSVREFSREVVFKDLYINYGDI